MAVLTGRHCYLSALSAATSATRAAVALRCIVAGLEYEILCGDWDVEVRWNEFDVIAT